MTRPLWRAEVVGDSFHMTPVDDWVAHENTYDCACGPKITPIPGIDGVIRGWLVRHRSLDNREGPSGAA